MLDDLNKIAAFEKRLADAAKKRAAAEEAAEIKRHVVATRFAASFPAFAADVAGRPDAMAAPKLAGLPEQDWTSRQLVRRAIQRAWTDTMLEGKERLDAARRGPGNRHDRRAAIAMTARASPGLGT